MTEYHVNVLAMEDGTLAPVLLFRERADGWKYVVGPVSTTPTTTPIPANAGRALNGRVFISRRLAAICAWRAACDALTDGAYAAPNVSRALYAIADYAMRSIGHCGCGATPWDAASRASARRTRSFVRAQLASLSREEVERARSLAPSGPLAVLFGESAAAHRTRAVQRARAALAEQDEDMARRASFGWVVSDLDTLSRRLLAQDLAEAEARATPEAS